MVRFSALGVLYKEFTIRILPVYCKFQTQHSMGRISLMERQFVVTQPT